MSAGWRSVRPMRRRSEHKVVGRDGTLSHMSTTEIYFLKVFYCYLIFFKLFFNMRLTLIINLLMFVSITIKKNNDVTSSFTYSRANLPFKSRFLFNMAAT